MAAIDSTNQANVGLINNMYQYFNTGGWQYMYDRLIGAKSYLLNPANGTGLLYAYNTMGDPSKVQGYNGSLLWYYTAYYGNLYPLPASDPANCQQISTAITALAQELATSDKQYVADGNANQHSARTSVIGNLNTAFNGLYTGLSCDAAIQTQQQTQEQAANQTALTAAQNSELAVYTATQGTSIAGIPVTTTNIAIICAIVVASVIGVAAYRKFKH